MPVLTVICTFSMHRDPSQHNKSVSEIASPQSVQVQSSLSTTLLHLREAVWTGRILNDMVGAVVISTGGSVQLARRMAAG